MMVVCLMRKNTTQHMTGPIFGASQPTASLWSTKIGSGC